MVIQLRRYSPQGLAGLAQTVDLAQHSLLGRVRLNVLSIRAQAIAKLDVAHALAIGTLVTLASLVRSPICLVFPLAYRRHDV